MTSYKDGAGGNFPRQGEEEIRDTPIEIAIVAFGIVVLSGPSVAPSDVYVRQIPLMLGVILSMFVLMKPKSRRRSSIPMTAFLVLLGGYSYLWSDDPHSTLWSVLLALCAVVYGELTGRRLSGDSIVVAVIVASLIAGVASLLLWIAIPDRALVSVSWQTGALRGIYIHRGHLATISLYGLIASFTYMIFIAKKWRLIIPVVLTQLFILVRASSVSAMLVTSMAMVSLIVLRFSFRVRRGRRLATLLTALYFSIWVAALAVSERSSVFDALGRDETLTGRTEMWRWVIHRWQESMWFGVGWGGAWTDSSPTQQFISNGAGFRVFHAHNSYLDILLQVGIVGFFLMLIAIAQPLILALRLTINGESAQPMVAFALVIISSIMISSLVGIRLIHPLGIALLTMMQSGLTTYNQRESSMRVA